MQPNTKLVIEDDAGKTIMVPFAREEITIGRKEGNTIRLTERNVSRNHAKITRSETGFFIEDLNSYNGIKLNGDRIKGAVEVQEHDLIEIGDYHLALQTEGAIETLPARPVQNANPSPQSQRAPDLSHLDVDDEFAGDTVRVDSMPDLTQEAMPLADPGAPTLESGRLEEEDTAAMPLLDDTDVQDAPSPGLPRTTSPLLSSVLSDPDESEETIRYDTTSGAPADEPMPPPPGLQSPISKPPARDPSRTQPMPAGMNPLLDPIDLEPTPTPLTPPAATTPDADLDDEATQALPRAPGANQHSSRPRLIALNTVFAGTVWPLDRGDSVIGRTEDNDLTIQHKSVSRNHAKIVQDGARFRIFDLQSANGVLVNGDEIESVFLEPADEVELGRVRLRFVPAGELFSLTPEQIEAARLADFNADDDERSGMVTSPTSRPSGGRPPLLLGLMGVVIILLLVVIIYLLVGGGDDDKTADGPNGDTPVNVTGLGLDDAKAAFEARDWKRAEKLASAAVTAGDASGDAELILTRSQNEIAARALLDKAEAERDAGQLKKAIASYTAAAEQFVGAKETEGLDEIISALKKKAAATTVAVKDPEPDQVTKTKSKPKAKPKSKPKRRMSWQTAREKLILAGVYGKWDQVYEMANFVPENKRDAEVLHAMVKAAVGKGSCTTARRFAERRKNKVSKVEFKKTEQALKGCAG